MPTPAPARLLLVDDHPTFSQGLSLLLHAEAGDLLRVAGTVRDAAQAGDVAVALQVDLALVDLVMPPPGGLAAVRALRERRPGLPVVALSGSEGAEAQVQALRAGAVAFLPKALDATALVTPLRAVLEGWAVVRPALLTALAPGADGEAARLVAELGEADLRLWRLVAAGRSPAELAAELYVSERTAKRLVAALLVRLGVDDRVQAAALAGRAGLLG